MIKVLYICLIMILSFSCSESVEFNDNSALSYPIRFSPDVMNVSRNVTLNSIYGEEFGVRAYIYEKSSDWNTKRSTQKPDANWYDVKVTCSDIGECTYLPVQKWNSAMRYSFFAYHPHTSNSNGQITLSPTTQEDVPVLTYTMSSDAFTSFNKVSDLMIASAIDLTDQYTSFVELNFNHCLFAINLVVSNLNEASTTIDELVFDISDIKYNQIQVKMDNSGSTPQNTTGANIAASYNYLSAPVVIPSTLNSSPYKLSENKALMFIPQYGLTGIATVTLAGGTPQQVPFDFSEKEFEPGHAYTLSIQIAGNNITIEILQDSVWKSYDSDIEFD